MLSLNHNGKETTLREVDGRIILKLKKEVLGCIY
jgi:hypothetical protein